MLFLISSHPVGHVYGPDNQTAELNTMNLFNTNKAPMKLQPKILVHLI
jgi:hypothetical protein